MRGRGEAFSRPRKLVGIVARFMSEPVEGSTSSNSPDTDVESALKQLSDDELRTLAQLVYQLMLQDIRWERERGG